MDIEIQNLDFLRDRIHEIRSALFANTSEAAFKLPTCIISAMNIDNEGQICFFIRRPEMLMEEKDKSFACRLDFFRKGKPFFLKISGQAQLYADHSNMMEYIGLPGDLKVPSMKKLLLVKVKVLAAEYHEVRTRVNYFNWKELWSQVREIFSRNRPQPVLEHSYSLQ